MFQVLLRGCPKTGAATRYAAWHSRCRKGTSRAQCHALVHSHAGKCEAHKVVLGHKGLSQRAPSLSTLHCVHSRSAESLLIQTSGLLH